MSRFFQMASGTLNRDNKRDNKQFDARNRPQPPVKVIGSLRGLYPVDYLVQIETQGHMPLAEVDVVTPFPEDVRPLSNGYGWGYGKLNLRRLSGTMDVPRLLSVRM